MKKILLLITLIHGIACSKSENQNNIGVTTIPNNTSNNSQTTPTTPSTPSCDPCLIWSDEFDVDGAPSEENWFLETVPPNNGSWWNQEDQYYTDRRENSIVEDGFLKIIALREDYENKKYTSARMTTQNLFDFTYGEVHVRAKLPQGQGTWPAIWMLGVDHATLGWPECGEIDIMEHGDKDPGLVSSAVHLPNANGDHYYVRGEQQIENESSEFHVYKVKWSIGLLEFFVDDVRHHQFTTDYDMPFWKPFFLILNVAMGGTWTDNNIDPDFQSATMEIDYVRVYQ